MPIDRRITNGLAWAGALLVIAIPAADIAMNQFAPRTAPRVAVVAEPAATAPTLPTPVSQRPRPVVVAEQPAVAPAPERQVATVAAPQPAAEPVATPDPVTTATTRPSSTGGDAVDEFLRSGRPMPSYISGAGVEAPAQTATVPATPAGSPEAAPAAVAPASEQVATVPRTRIVSFPTPVSQRPASLVRPQVAAQPPLIIDQQPATVSASDLEDWESGPLSEFLARRQGGQPVQPDPDYDPDGFFLDQGPNSSVRFQRFPRAYGEQYYPFE
jgi:hypothetical protein